MAESHEIQHKSSKAGAKEMLFKYLVYLPLFIICTGSALFTAYAYLRYQVPTFTSSLSLLIKDNRQNRPSEDMALSDVMMYRKSSSLANETEVLKTTSLMSRVVKSLGLNTLYYTEGKLKRSEDYSSKQINVSLLSLKDSLSSVQIDFLPGNPVMVRYEGKKQKYSAGMTVDTKVGTFMLNANTQNFNKDYIYSALWQPVKVVAGGLASSLSVKNLNKDASILRLTIDTEIPEKGRNVLDQLVKEYNKVNVEDKNRVVDNTIRFIDERIDLLTSELGTVEAGLQNYRQSNQVVDIGVQTGTEYGELNATRNKITDQEVKLQVIDMVSSYVSNPDKRYQLVPSSLGIEDPTLGALVADYNRLQLSREEQLKTIPAENPLMKVQENQLEKVRTSIIENLANIKKSQENLNDRFRSEYKQLYGRLQTVPRKQRQLLEIERQQGVKEKLFLFLREKREESAITRASAVPNSSSLDPAISSSIPVRPDRTGTYRMALILGLLIPVAFIYIRDLLNDKVTTRSDITKVTAAPVLAEIGHHEAKTRKLVIGVKDRGILAEQFRILRTNLQFFIKDKTNPVLLVTSTVAGEGKTFCSMNLAAVWAVAGKKTVILELDLRKPRISKTLEIGRDVGITNFLLGQIEVEELPVPLKGFENLDIIPAGIIPPNPSELLLDKKLDDLFAYLRKTYDMIVIDTAPVGLVSDAKILGRFADASIYVLRQRFTVKKQLTMMDDVYSNNLLPHMALLVNDVKVGGAYSYYGYGYGYGYGYSYDYGYNYQYGNDHKKPVWKKVKEMMNLWF